MLITIKGRVISKKNNWLAVRTRYGARIVASSRWNKFEKEAISQIKKQYKGQTIKKNLFVDYTFLLKATGAVDLDNLIVGVNDLLQKAGVIENDRQIRSGSFRAFEHQPEYVTEISIQQQ